jgi:hypothetical protein
MYMVPAPNPFLRIDRVREHSTLLGDGILTGSGLRSAPMIIVYFVRPHHTDPPMLRDITTSVRLNSDPGPCIRKFSKHIAQKTPRQVHFTQEGLFTYFERSNRSNVGVGNTGRKASGGTENAKQTDQRTSKTNDWEFIDLGNS